MNKDGASFGDVCIYREGADNNENIICALQAKKWKKPVPIDLLTKEHTMNTETIRNIQQGSTLDNQRIKNARTITVLITTANVTEQAYWQFSNPNFFPEDCLLIYQGNFSKFFETLKKRLHFNDADVEKILDNMPYHSSEDLLQKLPAFNRYKGLVEEMQFLPYQPEKRCRI
ncbi:10235_t:CDS:2, partial [Paraglomus occultum]